MLYVNNLHFSYGNKQILNGVSLDNFQAGSLVALIGPNAAGKSTLFRCIAGLNKTPAGVINLAGKNATELSPCEWNNSVCFMPQVFASNAALTVFETTLLARKNQGGWRLTKQDIESVAAILWRLGIEHLANVYIGELSGGQQLMVSIAHALIRKPQLFLLDEPTSALDLRHQLEIMTVIKKITKDRNIITIVALHDLNLAARFADRVVLLREGSVVGDGSADKVLPSTEICDTYGVNIDLCKTNKGLTTIAAYLP